MKLKCPACGAPIASSAINVQQMVAVCPECDNVFQFEGIFRQQRRKIKAPAQFQVSDDDPNRLDMAFKWSWRTEPPFALVGVLFALSVSLLMLIGMVSDGAPPPALLIPLAPASLMSYILLTLALNRTHYESDGETLTVYTEPLPYFRYGKKTLAVDEISEVTVERPAYAPFPEGKAGFYNVYVHTLDGDKVQIAAYVNYEHAHFIAQEVKAYAGSRQEIPAALATEDEGRETDSESVEQAAEEPTRKATLSRL
jgi:hypothetical protein